MVLRYKLLFSVPQESGAEGSQVEELFRPQSMFKASPDNLMSRARGLETKRSGGALFIVYKDLCSNMCTEGKGGEDGNREEGSEKGR